MKNGKKNTVETEESEGEQMENPIVYCDNYDCKYWDGCEGCTRESIIIMGPGQYPTCDSFEPDEEDESDG